MTFKSGIQEVKLEPKTKTIQKDLCACPVIYKPPF